jgi:hypothetical protein
MSETLGLSSLNEPISTLILKKIMKNGARRKD